MTSRRELNRFGFTCCCSENNDEFSVNVDEKQRPSRVIPSLWLRVTGRDGGGRDTLGFLRWLKAKGSEIEMVGFWCLYSGHLPFKIWSQIFTACKYLLVYTLSYWSLSRMDTCQFAMLRPSAALGQFNGSGLDEKNYYTVALILGQQPHASSSCFVMISCLVMIRTLHYILLKGPERCDLTVRSWST